MMDNTYHYRGDRAEFTGNSNVVHGAQLYEIRMLEGHETGKLRWTTDPPTLEARNQRRDERTRAAQHEWREEQTAFARLNRKPKTKEGSHG